MFVKNVGLCLNNIKLVIFLIWTRSQMIKKIEEKIIKYYYHYRVKYILCSF